jgi:hypothetical protein
MNMQMQQRPVGVSILAVAAGVLGVLALVGTAAWWGASDGIAWLPRIHGAERLIALCLLMVGVLELVLAYGAWMLRPWAWTLGVVLEVTALVLAVLGLGRADSGRHILTIVIAVITLWYLATPRVRAAFERI